MKLFVELSRSTSRHEAAKQTLRDKMNADNLSPWGQIAGDVA